MKRPEDVAEEAQVSPVQDDAPRREAQEPRPARASAGGAGEAPGAPDRGIEAEAEEAQLADEIKVRRRPWPALALFACLAAAAAAVLALTGGGGEQRQPAPRSELRIALDPDGDGPRPELERVVRCPSKRWRAACRELARLPARAFRGQGPRRACPEIYGGPDRVTVRGRFRGREVVVDLSRTDGCEIARFERWRGVLRRLYPRYRPGSALG